MVQTRNKKKGDTFYERAMISLYQQYYFHNSPETIKTNNKQIHHNK